MQQERHDPDSVLHWYPKLACPEGIRFQKNRLMVVVAWHMPLAHIGANAAAAVVADVAELAGSAAAADVAVG
jgi:hypothetical protein